jgi:hypothetical protein
LLEQLAEPWLLPTLCRCCCASTAACQVPMPPR